MGWIKLDDQFRNHSKVLAAGPDGAWLYVCGLCYISQHGTGDFIPARALVELMENPDNDVVWLRLIRANLWRKVQDGFRIADWLNCAIMPNRTTQEARKCREYIAWRNAVKLRDLDVCQACGEWQGESHAHHILPWASFPRDRFDVDNGLTLCAECHKALHREMREHAEMA
ncbi:hypothetical protein LCGC14_0520590 [marine sediment metagenome]|uniref:HNH nuclease domain-containing protein n=1 Tax=marine sediment metagenome TaxID=412755 RepID=A0A0F9UK64_9ZZZZ